MLTQSPLPTFMAHMWADADASLAVAWHEHGTTVIWIGGIVGACTVIWTQGLGPLVKRGVNRWKRILRYFDRMELTMDAVEKTLLTNNGGSTLLDKADRTERLAEQAVDLATEASAAAKETASKVNELLTKWEDTH